MNEGKRKPNRLIDEKSPYLLQHAYNPVDWYPWGEEAFKQAAQENKPVFLSIGYATCHWCHVMAHESFEDEQVAQRLNDAFVCVKVDREERPDIDGVYMAVCQLMTGSGGWPLTVLLTPDKEPFFAGTYFPKHSRSNHIGMLELVPRLRSVWTDRADEVFRSAKEITQALQKTALTTGTASLDESTLQQAQRELAAQFDTVYGGFGTRPKFPTPHQLTFLLRQWKRSGDEGALHIVEKTLQSMRLGGIYDHVGFGFHRYSTDEGWLVPHFEKMLYDQALLVMAYTEAFQATGKPEYRQTAEEVLAYVLRDMSAPQGGFYSAEDADSEGEEGKFYLWSEAELRGVLDPEEAELLIQTFNVTAEGNFFDEASGRKTGANILHLKRSPPELTVDSIRQKLFEARRQRVHPLKDDKILVDWNGLMIAALAKAAQAFDHPQYAQVAQKAAAFILQNMRSSEGRLWHRYRDGEATIFAYLDDYAFLTWGLLELYEATFEVSYLQIAHDLNGILLAHFWDQAGAGFFFTGDESEPLPVRQKEIYDGAIPSGNSVAMLNLLKLGRITATTEFEEKANQMSQAFSQQIKQSPSAFTQFLNAVDFALGPSYEVVLAGDWQAADTQAMLSVIQTPFVPNKVVLFHPSNQDNHSLQRFVPFIANHHAIDGKATAYVCANYRCSQPSTDIETLRLVLAG